MAMEHSKEWHGYWWLPESPETRVPGRLIVEPDGSSMLELIGRMVFQPDKLERRAARIFGSAGGRAFTLLECVLAFSRSGAWPAQEQLHKVRVQRVLDGLHVDDTEAVFSEARVHIENQSRWLSFKDCDRGSDRGDREYRATMIEVEPRTVTIDGWTIRAFSHAQPFQMIHLRERGVVSSEVITYLRITPPVSVAADGFDEIILEMMDLITLASGEPSGLIGLTLTHEDGRKHQNEDGTSCREQLEVSVYGKRIRTAAPDEPAPEYRDFRFTCDDMPFEQMVLEWLRVRRQAPTACNVYFGISYNSPGFTETRLLALATVAESLHRSLYGDATEMSEEHFNQLREAVLAAISDPADVQWLRGKIRNAPSYRQRLRALAGIPDLTARTAVVADVESWAARVVRARNGLAHEGHEGGDPDIFRLQSATSGLIALVLMAEIKLPAGVQQRAARDVLSLPPL